MKKYRQWLAEQDHMTESPDGDYYLVTEVDEQIAQIRLEKSKEFFACAKIVGELKEQIAALTKELKSLTEAYNNTDWKKLTDEQKDTIKNLTVRWGKCAAKDRRLREALKLYYLPDEIEALRGEEMKG